VFEALLRSIESSMPDRGKRRSILVAVVYGSTRAEGRRNAGIGSSIGSALRPHAQAHDEAAQMPVFAWQAAERVCFSPEKNVCPSRRDGPKRELARSEAHRINNSTYGGALLGVFHRTDLKIALGAWPGRSRGGIFIPTW
jgi:hypothetical protein